MVQHSSILGSECHEPKGTDTASSGDVYIADGAGSGAWTTRQSTISLHVHNIASAVDYYLPMPFAGTISKIQTALGGAISGSDVVFTVTNSSAASMGTLTITQSGSAAGDVDTLVPASNNVVTASDYIKISGNGGASGHVDTVLVVCVDGV